MRSIVAGSTRVEKSAPVHEKIEAVPRIDLVRTANPRTCPDSSVGSLGVEPPKAITSTGRNGSNSRAVIGGSHVEVGLTTGKGPLSKAARVELGEELDRVQAYVVSKRYAEVISSLPGEFSSIICLKFRSAWHQRRPPLRRMGRARHAAAFAAAISSATWILRSRTH